MDSGQHGPLGQLAVLPAEVDKRQGYEHAQILFKLEAKQFVMDEMWNPLIVTSLNALVT